MSKQMMVVEMRGELIGCSKSIKKCYDAIKKIEPGISSYATVCKTLKEEDAWGFELENDDSVNIKKTVLL